MQCIWTVSEAGKPFSFEGSENMIWASVILAYLILFEYDMVLVRMISNFLQSAKLPDIPVPLDAIWLIIPIAVKTHDPLMPEQLSENQGGFSVKHVQSASL